MTLTKSWLQKQVTDLEATRDEIPFGLDEDGNNTLAALKMALAGMEAEPVAYIGERMLESLIDGARSCGRVWPAVTDELSGERRIPLYKDTQPLTTSERAELENYRNAQQVVPEPLAGDIDADDHPLTWSYHNGWNACRASMLQGKAEPVTTAYNLPVNTPCKDAPEHIWLQTAGVWPENGEFSELTWCSDNQHQDDTLYVRADVMIGNSPVIPDGWVACSERMPHIGVPVITCCGDVVQYAAYSWDGKEWQDWYEEYDKLPASTFTHWHSRPAAPQQEVKP